MNLRCWPVRSYTKLIEEKGDELIPPNLLHYTLSLIPQNLYKLACLSSDMTEYCFLTQRNKGGMYIPFITQKYVQLLMRYFMILLVSFMNTVSTESQDTSVVQGGVMIISSSATHK